MFVVELRVKKVYISFSRRYSSISGNGLRRIFYYISNGLIISVISNI